MDVFISIDMEGIAGITTIRQTYRGTDDYSWARELMTEEANAATGGAFDAGADRVVVSDSHGDMANLLPHKLDQRAELVQGTPKLPHSMMTGIEVGYDCALFLGYHAGAGTQAAILDHTYAGFFTDVRVNGESWNETVLNAALAGTFGVPVALVVGDRACCQQAEAALPGVRTVAVKEAFGQRVGRSLSPEWARTVIRSAAEQAVAAAGSLRPFRPKPPYTFEVDGISTAIADMGMLVPRTERPAGRTLRYETDDMRELYQVLLAWMSLGARVAPRYQID
ncbi:MAG: M55 family metallopeptidase [Actinobacteria bacterium]|nr:M55 family metallopeptidase [Actinomycetota bacterium]